jgi:hypothetical protein
MNRIVFRGRQRRLLLAYLAFGSLFLAGCGDGRPKRVPVFGRVLIEGRPLQVGFVQVVPQGNRPAHGALDDEGRFTLGTFEETDGCVLGKHRVAVIANKNISPTALRWFAPKKYMSIATSGLTIEVNGPRNDVEIDLTWKGSSHDGPFTEQSHREY